MKIAYSKLYTLRADGRYQGYWHDAEGRRHTICDRDPERLHRRIAEKEAPPEITFGLLAETWHSGVQGTYKDGTWAEYEAPYKRALDRFGELPAEELTSADIAAHLAVLALQGYGERSLKAQRTIYSLIYKYAAQQPNLVAFARYNPAAMAALPAKRKRPMKRKAPDDAALARIILGVNTDFGLYPYLLLCTGLRRGEALGLRWRDVDLKHSLIYVREGAVYRKGKASTSTLKTEGSERTVPILPMLRAILETVRDRPDVYLFHGEDPLRPLAEATYRRRWHRWCRANGFAEKVEDGVTAVRKQKRYTYKYTLTAHVLRHGYASISSWGGLDVNQIRALLGHTNVRTTELYIHELQGTRAPGLAEAAATIQEELREILRSVV